MSFGQIEGFFVDTCVLLPHAIPSVTESCLNFLKENFSRCFLSSSVKKEAIELIESAYKYIANLFRSELKPFLEKAGIKELSNKDGKIMAQFFMKTRKKLRRIPKHYRSNVPHELLSAVESYVASKIHSLKSGIKIPVDNFLAALLSELAVKNAP